MSLRAGIVGLPNVGKSTLFNALTAADVEAANYPFATIEPNVGVVPVPDERLAQINSVIETQRIVPAVVEIVDIAGLVRGASEGEGLGNQFLGHIRTVDAILEVVRCFDDPDITHVEGSVDPIRASTPSDGADPRRPPGRRAAPGTAGAGRQVGRQGPDRGA